MHLPGPLRAAVGLAAVAADELKQLPDRAVELPMLAVSTALQMSLRAQQRYARLASRGEQVLNREQPGEDPPPWAMFDEPVSAEELRRTALSQLDSLIGDDGIDPLGRHDPDDGPATGRLLDELLGPDDAAAEGSSPIGARSDAAAGPAASTGGTGGTVTPITRAPGAAKSGGAPRRTARKAATRGKSADGAAPAATRPNRRAKAEPRSSGSTKKASLTPESAGPDPTGATNSAKKAAAPDEGTAPAPTAAPKRQVNKPRHTAPSKFDDAGDS